MLGSSVGSDVGPSARLCDSAAASRLERAEVADETTMADIERPRMSATIEKRVSTSFDGMMSIGIMPVKIGRVNGGAL